MFKGNLALDGCQYLISCYNYSLIHQRPVAPTLQHSFFEAVDDEKANGYSCTDSTVMVPVVCYSCLLVGVYLVRIAMRELINKN